MSTGSHVARDGPKLTGAELDARLERTWARPPGGRAEVRSSRASSLAPVSLGPSLTLWESAFT